MKSYILPYAIKQILFTFLGSNLSEVPSSKTILEVFCSFKDNCVEEKYKQTKVLISLLQRKFYLNATIQLTFLQIDEYKLISLTSCINSTLQYNYLLKVILPCTGD